MVVMLEMEVQDLLLEVWVVQEVLVLPASEAPHPELLLEVSLDLAQE
jgi:hypothetical protein